MQEIKRWLLSYGAEVEVIEPLALRAEIAAEVKKVASIYGG
jgi:predicted DNA-binding transcriptional regulator YafY